MDHGLRAAPHGFSQLATSFLACPRLGILRAPLLRLTRVHFPYTPVHLLFHLLRSLIVMTAFLQSLSFPHPLCQKAFSTHFRAELTKIKDPPITVNPNSGLALSRIRGRPAPT